MHFGLPGELEKLQILPVAASIVLTSRFARESLTCVIECSAGGAHSFLRVVIDMRCASGTPDEA